MAKEAIALQYHDPATERAAMILPPAAGTPGVAVAQSKWEPVRDLAGPRDSSAVRCISFSLLEESCSTLTHPVASVHDPAQTTCVDRRRRLEVWTEEDTGSQDPRVSSSVGGFRGSWLLSLGSVHAGRGGEHVRFVRAREDFKRV